MENKRTPEELKVRIAQFRMWYHKIDLGNGVVTPGRDYDTIWDNIRASRSHINYNDKTVLDLGSWDGMWAFEAEQLARK